MSTVLVRILNSLAENQAVAEMLARGADYQAVAHLEPKFSWLGVVVSGLALEQAVGFRKQAQAAGVQASLSRALLAQRGKEAADVILVGSLESLTRLAETLAEIQPEAAQVLSNALMKYRLPVRREWHCGTRTLPLGAKTLVMGILNATPDSFSGDGFADNLEAGLQRARQMVADGADILDIGGESTRPGAESVPADEELQRVIPLIDRIGQELDIPISIDTTKAAVAKEALAHGACIINDVTGLHADAEMAQVAAQAGAGVVIMHIQGSPRDMQKDPQYADLMGEIAAYLTEGVSIAEAAGIAADQIVIDPGIGFGKTLEHNLEILRRLRELRTLGYPLLVGTSRKSSIGKLLGTEAADRLEGTAATVALALAASADIVRVHDVKEMARVAKVSDAILRVEHTVPEDAESVKWGGTAIMNAEL